MKAFIVFFLFIVILALYPFIEESDDSEVLTGLPWQIEILPDGSSQVFGLTIGSSRLSDAIETLGHDMELAIIAATDEGGSLEMYYGHYKAGLLSGKLVLQTNVSEQSISRWRENAIRSEYMATGMAKKYYLSEEDLTQVMDEVITGLTFIPAVNLDEEVIRARFGEPARQIKKAEMIHFLYPSKGLDVVLYHEAKDVIQYVAPSMFQQFIAPLESEVQE